MQVTVVYVVDRSKDITIPLGSSDIERVPERGEHIACPIVSMDVVGRFQVDGIITLMQAGGAVMIEVTAADSDTKLEMDKLTAKIEEQERKDAS